MPEYAEIPWVQPLEELNRDDYDAVEVHPVYEDVVGGHCEVVLDDGPVSFWSCYLHCKEGGIECVADFDTKSEAEAYAETLNNWLKEAANV